MNELDVVRSVNFDWAMRLSEVWSDASWDIPELHANVRAEFVRKLEAMRDSQDLGSPLGWVIVGAGGTGKTHLLGSFRREATRRKCAFVLVDMTDVRTFWESVLQGYIDSLQQSFGSDIFQYEWVLRNMIERLGPNKPVAQILSMLAERKSKDLQGDIGKVLAALSKVFRKETLKYQNVVRALICLNSDDLSISSLGMTWLQGQALEDDERKALGFSANCEQPSKIVEALSWFMSLSGPMVLAFDQLDPIVTQLHYRKQGVQSTEEQATAEAIIVEIGSGLGSLRDVTRNTLTIISCVESTWQILGNTVRSRKRGHGTAFVHRNGRKGEIDRGPDGRTRSIGSGIRQARCRCGPRQALGREVRGRETGSSPPNRFGMSAPRDRLTSKHRLVR